jgi:hypothetical protein
MNNENQNSKPETLSSQGSVKVSNNSEPSPKVVWEIDGVNTMCCNYPDIMSHGNREWCSCCGHVYNY